MYGNRQQKYKLVSSNQLYPVMDSSDSWKPLLDQLPKESFWDNPLYQWDGFWYRAYHLEAALALRSQFTARLDDIILASPMKTGTTWLKALCFCIVQRQLICEQNGQKVDEETLANSDEEDHKDPLVKNHPAVYVQTLEIQVFTDRKSVV